jgi:hypothetical protein
VVGQHRLLEVVDPDAWLETGTLEQLQVLGQKLLDPLEVRRVPHRDVALDLGIELRARVGGPATRGQRSADQQHSEGRHGREGSSLTNARPAHLLSVLRPAAGGVTHRCTLPFPTRIPRAPLMRARE